MPALPTPDKVSAMHKPAAADAFKPWTWEAVCADPHLRDLPFKIELNRYNQIVMSPANTFHSRYQTKIAHLLQRLLKGGESIVELAVMTGDNVKVPDVVWASKQALKTHAGEKINWSSPPEVCVEVVSPSNTSAEIEEKRALYLESGAQEVWVCDLDGKMSFFSAAGELKRSTLCPKFPLKIKL